MVALVGLLAALAPLILYWTKRPTKTSKRIPNPREMFSKLFDELQAGVWSLNELSNLRAHSPGDAAIDELERRLNHMEATLSFIITLIEDRVTLEQLQTITSLPYRVNQRIEATKKTFRKALLPRAVFGLGPKKIYRPSYEGCYFCSNPLSKNQLQLTQLKYSGAWFQALGCSTCVPRLNKLGYVKILHFQEFGQAVHWSLSEAFSPSPRYWELNKN